MMCSVLIPTRGRPLKLRKCIHSLCSTATRQDFEILVRFDADDAMMRGCGNWLHEYASKLQFICGPRPAGGWGGIGAAVQSLADMAKGTWCWPLNDDVEVEGDWLGQLALIDPRNLILHPEVYYNNISRYEFVNDGPFPIVPTNAWKNVGEGELASAWDAWLFKTLHLRHHWPIKFLAGVTVDHQREIDATLPKERY